MIIQAANKLQHINEYYFSMKLKQIAQMRAEGKPIINLGIGNPDQAPSTATIDALITAAANVTNHGYQSYIGIPELRTALSNWYKKTYEVALQPTTEVLPLLGSKEGISYISHAFLNPGDKVLVPNPGYPTYTSATYLAGAEPVSYNLDASNNWAPDFTSIPESVLQEAKIIWINYPNMPTGAAGNQEIFSNIIALAKKYNILVVNDNPYSLVLNEGQPVSILQTAQAKDVCLELNSLSKSHNLAGARIGMIAGAKDYIDTILKVKSNVDSGMYLPVQHAAIAALSNSDEWHLARNNEYKKRRTLAYAIMDELECVYDTNQIGMFLWAKIPDRYENVEVLTEHILQDANVFITPGFIFGSNGDRYIRISLCSPEKDLQEALIRIKNTKSSV
ncbi:MAG TPA: aminotransferase class I/II-fold pyridoxal phosphate-dependent enzyme [Chitinophagales bacterium]|nr:aminotransferase class I/II-fold pyridoxal phosphate-dependent enzyme [Chitinophagales bacterium]HMW12386.1 aminotransferase class I/II-fold pyridoxal phosphate-dependent enzyme [Chitinophagales bacterium]HMX60057.1 aminotransferase class I/II-fold pyridoxal phosphate-dependent enzyme [Chitinophagales bacterium]HMY23687.1 aminotransferase class I/II-fold pyridoxal phosphate-dependent enzyme [Chitinophagales bacterium]HMZ32468.1 aminotransferase class I/II-fold pyridoxal phosphate-dependent e